ncbi:acid protease [Dentipellis sp. KUC8613]|nr:acid protease [Dentipellis sp. KUC8613]
MRFLSKVSIILAAGYLASVEIRNARAHPLAATPSQQGHDDILRIIDSYDRSSGPNSTVNELLESSSLRRRNAQPIFIPLDPGKGDVPYFASLRIGTNPNPFRIIADTGSADFWVYSSTCPTRGNKNSVNALPVPGTRAISLRYENGAGLTAGTIREAVNFGGQFVDLMFAAATKVSAMISSGPEDGLMGFSRASASAMGLPPVVDSLAQSGLIPERVTGWKLSRGIDGRNDGELVLGGVNPTKFVARSKVTVRSLDPGHWLAPIEAASINGARVINSPRVAILDTGAPDISMSFEDAEALHAVIPGLIVTHAGDYFLPCDNRAVLSLSIGGTSWPVDPRDLVNEPAPPEARLPPGYCYSSIQSVFGRQPGEWLVGSPFLKNVYMTLDSTANTIGIARLR